MSPCSLALVVNVIMSKIGLLNSKQCNSASSVVSQALAPNTRVTVKILKFGTPQTIAISVLIIEKFYVTLR